MKQFLSDWFGISMWGAWIEFAIRLFIFIGSLYILIRCITLLKEVAGG